MVIGWRVIAMINRRNSLVLTLAGGALIFLGLSAAPSHVQAAPCQVVCRHCMPGTPPTCPYIPAPGAIDCVFSVNGEGSTICTEIGNCH